MKETTNVRKLIRDNETGLHERECTESVKALSRLLADTYLLYLKTQNFHWNVEDRTFAMLHEFLDTQYKQLAEAVDEIAERIRMLNHYTPATFSEFLKLTSLSEKEAHPKTGQAMLERLLKDHEILIFELRKTLKDFEHSHDEGTIDFLIQRLREHEKMAWMLRSHLR